VKGGWQVAQETPKRRPSRLTSKAKQGMEALLSAAEVGVMRS